MAQFQFILSLLAPAEGSFRQAVETDNAARRKLKSEHRAPDMRVKVFDRLTAGHPISQLFVKPPGPRGQNRSGLEPSVPIDIQTTVATGREHTANSVSEIPLQGAPRCQRVRPQNG